MQASDALLLGRTTYDIFRRYWPGQTDGIGQAFDRVPKYVASRGTPELSWDEGFQVTDAGTEVRDLRERHEQIHTWGSADLLQTLFREGLVDQVNLWVCPVVIGQGKNSFPKAPPPPGSSWPSRRGRTPEVRHCSVSGASRVPRRRWASETYVTSDPVLLHTAIDARDCRGLAEFYRQLLGLHYRDGEEPPTDGSHETRTGSSCSTTAATGW